MKQLILLRGLPGSGKSTFAKMLPSNFHFETDMFFIDQETKEYKFEPSELKRAHQWCHDRVEHAMSVYEANTISVSNTFTQEWEMEPYYKLAEQYGYRVTSLVVENRHGSKSVHNVPEETLEKMNKLDLDYQNLLKDVLDNGIKKSDRTGTGTISVFGRQIRHNMKDGFPLLTTKKMAWKTMVTELLWFLRGDTNIKYLIDNDCHIWDGDAYKNYCNQIPEYSKQFTMSKEEYIDKIKTDDEFANKWGELGPIYGKQWRDWQDDFGPNRLPLFPPNNKIDQIQNLINDLKTNPDSRRLMVSAWNVGELDQMVLPPCHYGFQVYTRKLTPDEYVDIMVKKHGVILEGGDDTLPTRAISLMFNMRSNDVPLGLPFNIASYALLLKIIGKIVNMVPDELIGNLGDCHIYLNQIEGVKEQIGREPLELPTLKLPKTDAFWDGFDVSLFGHLEPSDFQIEGYKSHPSIKIPLSN